MSYVPVLRPVICFDVTLGAIWSSKDQVLAFGSAGSTSAQSTSYRLTTAPEVGASHVTVTPYPFAVATTFVGTPGADDPSATAATDSPDSKTPTIRPRAALPLGHDFKAWTSPMLATVRTYRACVSDARGFPHVLHTGAVKTKHNASMALANVILIEDDAFSRTLLTAALKAGGFNVCAAGSLAKVALAAQRDFDIDVAILDIDLGAGPTGIDIAHALREVDRAIGIVLLTSFSDPRLSAAQGIPLPQGARYLTKSTIEDMAKVITVVLQAKYAPLKNPGRSPSIPELTSQQIQALKLVAAGVTNAEIARQLEISEKAVEHLISRINENLGISKSSSTNARVQLVRKFSDLAGGQLP